MKRKLEIVKTDERLLPKSLRKSQIKKKLPYDPSHTRLLGELDENLNRYKQFEGANQDVTKYDTYSSYLFNEAKPLFNEVGDSKILTTRFLPKQNDLDAINKKISQTILHTYDIPTTRMELINMQKGDYYLGDIYKYTLDGTLPLNKKKAKTVKKEEEEYILIHDVLFKINQDKERPDEYNIRLCVPAAAFPWLISQVHDSILGGHQGIGRIYNLMRKKYYMKSMFSHIVDYIRSCQTCQMAEDHKEHEYKHTPRYFTSAQVCAHWNMDLMSLPEASTGEKYLLLCSDTITRYVIGKPLRQRTAMNIAIFIRDDLIGKYGKPKSLVMDRDTCFHNEVIDLLTSMIKIKPIFISPYNHGSNVVERKMKNIRQIILKSVKAHKGDWINFAQLSLLSHNCTPSSVLGWHSPFELVYGRSCPTFEDLDLEIPQTMARTHQEYLVQLKASLQEYMKTVMEEQRKSQEKLMIQTSGRKEAQFNIGDLVWVFAPELSNTPQPSRKFSIKYRGPMIVFHNEDSTHHIIADLAGRIVQGIYHSNRLRKCWFRIGSNKLTGKPEVATNLRDLIPFFKKNKGENLEFCDASKRVIKTLKSDEIDLNKLPSIKVTETNDVKMKSINFLTKANEERRERHLRNRTYTRDYQKNGYGFEINRIRIKDGIPQLLVSFNDSKERYWDDIENWIQTEQEMEMLYQIIREPGYRITGGSFQYLLEYLESYHEYFIRRPNIQCFPICSPEK